MNQNSFLDYLMLTLAAIVWWRFFYLAHSPPAADAESLLAEPPAAQPAPPPSAEPVQPLDDALEAICLAGAYADSKAVVTEAQGIYDAVTTAFAAGDIAPQASLLADDVREAFVAALATRHERGESMERTFIGFHATDIVAAGMSGGYGWLDIRFDTETVTALRDRDGNVIAGDAQRVVSHSEIWSFERDFRARGNWLVAATSNA